VWELLAFDRELWTSLPVASDFWHVLNKCPWDCMAECFELVTSLNF